jgi:hypothetical protein
MDRRTYSDAQLVAAVAAARSWRDVLRRLDLSATSAAAIRSVRGHAERLGLSTAHFTGQRRWSDAQLAEAIAAAASWSDVLGALGLAGGSSTSAIKGHAVRLGLDLRHLSPAVPQSAEGGPQPSAEHLHRGGALLASAWLAMSGFDVSWPLEPARYDLVAGRGPTLLRVQVKTTRTRSGASWVVHLGSTSATERAYDPDDLDYFFCIDADLGKYLIPIEVVAGRVSIVLRRYDAFRLPDTLI